MHYTVFVRFQNAEGWHYLQKYMTEGRTPVDAAQAVLNKLFASGNAEPVGVFVSPSSAIVARPVCHTVMDD